MSQTKAQPALTIIYQYVKDLSFEAPHLAALIRTMREAPAVEMALEVRHAPSSGAGEHEVELHIKATAKSASDTFFICELTYGALVALGDEAPADTTLMVEVPRLLFPFARAIIAEITRESGMPPLIMAPIDFAALYAARQSAPAPEQTPVQ
ncbi:protein-export protein SecB [Alphaproteobacteria bacterium]|nr:protein-export protein SecB [Alphaproteobacteria bacterium]